MDVIETMIDMIGIIDTTVLEATVEVERAGKGAERAGRDAENTEDLVNAPEIGHGTTIVVAEASVTGKGEEDRGIVEVSAAMKAGVILARDHRVATGELLTQMEILEFAIATQAKVYLRPIDRKLELLRREAGVVAKIGKEPGVAGERGTRRKDASGRQEVAVPEEAQRKMLMMNRELLRNPHCFCI